MASEIACCRSRMIVLAKYPTVQPSPKPSHTENKIVITASSDLNQSITTSLAREYFSCVPESMVLRYPISFLHSIVSCRHVSNILSNIPRTGSTPLIGCDLNGRKVSDLEYNTSVLFRFVAGTTGNLFYVFREFFSDCRYIWILVFPAVLPSFPALW